MKIKINKKTAVITMSHDEYGKLFTITKAVAKIGCVDVIKFYTNLVLAEAEFVNDKKTKV